MPPGCRVSGQLWVSSALSSGSQPSPTLALFSGCHDHGALLSGTALALARHGQAVLGEGGPPLSLPPTAQPVRWTPEGRRLHSNRVGNHPPKWLVVCQGSLQILPKYPRLSSTSDTNPMKTRYFSADTGTLRSGCTRDNTTAQRHLCCVPCRAGGVPHLPAQSSLPGE